MNVRIEAGWHSALNNEFADDYFVRLADFVRHEYANKIVFPPGSLIFNAFDLCPYDMVRVVIVGQDPYHNHGQAHGLCFSVTKGVDYPPSLVNIFREIESDLGVKPFHSGDLGRWAAQGVLLLNSILTVRLNEPGSHQNRGWERFTDAAINLLSSEKHGLVFMLWGRYAQDKGRNIDSTRHLVLESAHPSPLSASRGFFGNRHFSRCNDYFLKQGAKPIDWR